MLLDYKNFSQIHLGIQSRDYKLTFESIFIWLKMAGCQFSSLIKSSERKMNFKISLN